MTEATLPDLVPPVATAAISTPPGAVGRWVADALRCERGTLAIALTSTLAGSVALAVGPSLLQRAIDDGLRAGDRGVLRAAVAGYLVSLMVAGVASGIRFTAMSIGGERCIHRLRVQSLEGILRLDLGTFERVPRGDLLSRVTADTEALSGAALWVVPEAVRHVADLCAALAAVALLDLRLALLALVAAPPMALAGRRLRSRSSLVYPRYRREVGSLLGQVTETVEGTDTVLAHGRGPDRLAKLAASNAAVTARFLDGTSMRNRFYASITLTRVAATAIVLVAASLLAADGTITVGTAAAGVLAVSGVFGPLAWLTELLDDVLSAKASLDRVIGAASIPEAHGGTIPLPPRGRLELEGVYFSYVAGRPILLGVDLAVEPGERVALIGETGAGKSTLARLAAGLARPDAGTIRFGGVDLVDACPDHRRRRLLFVLQESYCFDGTLAENLRLADRTATDARLLAAAEALGLVAWVQAHPDGLQRRVGAGGGLLSAGERQLVALLRVALADPAVVILDEATAVLDPTMEAAVGEALDRVLGDRTVLVIAHRPETAARCDRVLRISDGHAEVQGLPSIDG